MAVGTAGAEALRLLRIGIRFMQETMLDLARPGDSVKGGNGEHDALINKVALEMGSINNGDLASTQRAPDSRLSRYGLAAIKGIENVPAGVVHAVKNNIDHPVQALETLGMGVGMAAAMKFVLPEGGPAGTIAGAALGAYFTYQTAKPVIAGLKMAGEAQTMKELNMAAVQIGDAGGNYLVNSVIAGAGCKLGTMAADRVLATNALSGFRTAKAGFYDKLGDKLAGISDAAMLTVNPASAKPVLDVDWQGVIPPYVLEEMVRRNPGNAAYLRTYNAALVQHDQKVLPRLTLEQEDFHGAREVYDAQGEKVQPGEKARFEGEKPVADVEVNKAYDYTGDVREFYLKEYARNSIDGRGMKFVSTVNYGQNYQNAFWNGEQMTYGRPDESSPFKSFILRDVCAHEITHGVTQMEGGLTYHGQSGALNESISDVYGALINQYAQHQTADKADWLIGGGIWKDNINGKALRDMVNPGTAYNDPAIGKDPQPADMEHYKVTTKDKGGVHLNSGIPNRAFASFAKSVGGYAWDDPGHIWFEARKNAGSDPSFAQFAFQTVEAAKSMGKSDLIPKLEAAWNLVGVKPDANIGDVLTPAMPPPPPSDVSFISRLFSNKKAG
jgi:hypothetical protein